MAKNKKNSKKQAGNKTWIWVLLGLVAIVAAILIINFSGGSNPNKLPDTVTVQDASTRFEQGAFLLDVREQSEWDEAHVDGAVLIPLGELSARTAELPTDQDILIICRSGNRSAQARDLLRQAGFERTTSISGGINAWMAAGLPVISGN